MPTGRFPSSWLINASPLSRCRVSLVSGSGLQYVTLSSMHGLWPQFDKSAVVNFNCVLAILIAALRTLLGVLLWPFFDDTGYIQLQSEELGCSASELIDVLSMVRQLVYQLPQKFMIQQHQP
eukprot:6490661-Amphidinium_carterae.3